ncbi:Cysteine proteinase [Glarea lozoyensis ATCC 20868]|uniref:Ubiquitin carboxyl-terminal hydrolase n=1 Tax=Glarea lozoyensis (strain ATCC 20868 / MF5171) TaxID=1116229 RepID=S3D7R7_GLAL2|nr:Cysteine proteinase [Glarea lozoyensis ATCC 20868]EPE34557.1 Cysteine proteinase [Glarea lozoyensis ATCC 20868]
MDDDWVESPAKDLRSRRRSTRNRQVSKALSESLQSADSPQKRRSPSEEEPPKKRPQRARKTRITAPVEVELSTEEGLKLLTNEERMGWEGWVELESDPATFSYILRGYGVEGVKIQEVLSLDSEMLADLPKPVYGLIFLFTYRGSDDHDDYGLPREIPTDVWFANQTIQNSCATVAMLNIVMNVPEIELGQTLRDFKRETEGLEPAYRGKQLGENVFIRNTHNSFARKIDIHNVDPAEFDFEKWLKVMNKDKLINKDKSKKQKPPTISQGKKASRKNVPRKKKKRVQEEAAYHFIAYVPINGVVWRFDGLQHQPLSLGPAGDDWIAVARQHMEDRMTQYIEDGLQFNLLALCESPLLSIPRRLVEVIKSLRRVEGMLDYVKVDWKELAAFDPTLGQVDEMYGLTQEVLDSVRLSSVSIEIIEQAEGSVEDLMALHQEFFYELGQLRNSYINELAAINYENHQAALKMLEDTAAPEAQAEASTSMVDSDVHMTGGSTTSHTAADTPQDLQHEGEPAETASNGERPENELAAEARPATSTQEGQTNSTTKSGNDEMDLETAIPTSKAAEGSPDVSPVENTSSILSPDHLVQDQPATREERVEDHVAAENKQDDETP